MSVGWPRNVVLLLPAVPSPNLPNCLMNFPSGVNFRMWRVVGRRLRLDVVRQAAAESDPDVVLVIDVEAVRLRAPVVAGARRRPSCESACPTDRRRARPASCRRPSDCWADGRSRRCRASRPPRRRRCPRASCWAAPGARCGPTGTRGLSALTAGTPVGREGPGRTPHSAATGQGPLDASSCVSPAGAPNASCAGAYANWTAVTAV